MRNSSPECSRRHASVPHVIAEISAQLLTLTADTRDEVIAVVLQRLGTSLGVDRGYVFSFSDDMSRMTNTHEWCAEGIEPQMKRIQNEPADTLPWWKEKITLHKPVHIPAVNDLPSKARAEHEEFRSQGIQSLLCLPMIDQRGHLTGFMGFDAVRKPRSWSEQEIDMLTLTADLLATAMGRIQAQCELAEREELLEATGLMARVGGWQLDIETMTLTWTKETYRIHEIPQHETPSLDKAIEFFHPDDRDSLSQAIQRAIDRGEPYDMELRFITAKDNNLWTRTICRPDVVDGRTVRLRGIFQDITERKRAEAEQEQLQEQLIHNEKMKLVGRLAGGVAHDFNNMLTVILGHLELVMERVGPDDPLHVELDEIQKAARRSADLTQQLLAFSRKQSMFPKVLDLNETVENMLRMLRRLIGEDIDLVWRPGCGIGSCFIDPSQVDQILVNLCVNARNAIVGTGRIIIETRNISIDQRFIRRHEDFEPGDYILLTVSDDGRGMNAETLSHLFEPFFTGKQWGEGIGMGLATVHGIVKQNMGYVDVYSELGLGTSFKVYLPRHAAKTTPRLEQEQAPPPAGGETILLVEDEPAGLEIFKLMLEATGYLVITAAAPGEAIRLARNYQGRIDLIMTDMVMPEMNGRDLADNLMSIYPDIKHLFMSGYPADVIARQGLLDDGVHFIQKPCTKNDLAVKIREVLDRE